MTGTDRSLENKLEKWDQLSLTDGQIPIQSVRGKFIFRLGAYGKSSSSRWTYGSKTGAAYHLIGRELQRQLEKKNVKEELLKLDTKQVYDEQMKEQLDQALSYEYPYLEDTGLYTQMSVSELKNRVRSGVKKKISEQNERTCPKSDWTTNMKWNRKAVKQKMAKNRQKLERKGAFRGTAYHRALECLDLLAVTDQRKLEGDLLDLFQRGFLTEEAYESIFHGIYGNFWKVLWVSG